MKGIALLNGTEPLLNPAIREKQSAGEPNGSFAGIIKQAMNDVNQAQVEADQAIQELATGNEKDIHQTYLIMGVLATDMRDENRYAVKLIDRILGSGGSSRLSQRLREDEKRVYSVYSVAPMYEDTGCLAVYTACSPENVLAVELLILEEWERQSAPWGAAGLYGVNDIIDSRDTRKFIVQTLEMLRGNRDKVISEHRLQNWPTGF